MSKITIIENDFYFRPFKLVIEFTEEMHVREFIQMLDYDSDGTNSYTDLIDLIQDELDAMLPDVRDGDEDDDEKLPTKKKKKKR